MKKSISIKGAGFIEPMLATTAEKPFLDPNWIFEVKWDGYRIIANKSANKVRLFSRNGNDFSKRYPAVTSALSKIVGNFIMDGEVVVLDENGIPDFQQLQNYKISRRKLKVWKVCVLWILFVHAVGLSGLIDRQLLNLLLYI